MQRFKNILVVYNDAVGADDALTRAELLARINGARLNLVDVCAVGQRSTSLIRAREKRLARVSDGLQRDLIENVNYKILIGPEDQEIVRTVLAGRHDIVIVGSDGEESSGTIRRMLYGAPAVSLMRNCPCPVWVVKPDQKQATRILAAVNVDPSAPDTDALSIKVLEMASSLAEMKSADLHVLLAWDVEGKDASRLASEVPEDTRMQILAAHEESHLRAIGRMVSQHVRGDLAPTIHVARGTLVKETRSMIGALDLDVVVMGSAQRSHLAALLSGDAVIGILNDVECGVLTVKPDSFEVPFHIREGATAA